MDTSSATNLSNSSNSSDYFSANNSSSSYVSFTNSSDSVLIFDQTPPPSRPESPLLVNPNQSYSINIVDEETPLVNEGRSSLRPPCLAISCAFFCVSVLAVGFVAFLLFVKECLIPEQNME